MRISSLAFVLFAINTTIAFGEDSSQTLEKFMAARESIKEMSYGWRLDDPYRMSFIKNNGIAIKDTLTSTAYLFNSTGAFRAKLPRLQPGETAVYDVTYPVAGADAKTITQTESLLDSNANKYKTFTFGNTTAKRDGAIDFTNDKDPKYWEEFERYLATQLDLIETDKNEMSKVDIDGLTARLQDNFQAARALQSEVVDAAIARLIVRAQEGGFEIPLSTRNALKKRKGHSE